MHRRERIPGMFRLAAASMVGTAIEFYDFFTYGTAAALVLGPLFFPTVSPSSAHSPPSAPSVSGSSPARWARCSSDTSATAAAAAPS
ncbi:hypothetical protein GCM10020000_61650 [Streptomyces olivoverticillatus]